MDRMEKLEKIAAETLGKQFEESTKLVQEYYQMHEAEIQQVFRTKMHQGFKSCQEMGKKIYYIIFSVLESSNLIRSYEIQIAFYSEKMYLEDSPVYVYWSPAFLFTRVEEDMQFYRKSASHKVIRIKEYELDTIRKQYILNHYFQVLLLLMELLPAVLEEGRKYDCMAKETEILFGRYMEKPLLIYQTGGKEE